MLRVPCRYAGQTTVNATAPCNANCACHTVDSYFPVCGADGKSYYSSCHAGCSATSPSGDFSSCACVAGGTATPSVCSVTCNNLPITAVLFGLGMFAIFVNAAPALALLMRCFPPDHVSVGLSSVQTVWKVLGSIPGPIVMGALFDANCLYAQASCASGSSCVLYHNKSLADSYSALAIIGKGVSTVCFGVAAWLYCRRPLLPAVVEAAVENAIQHEVGVGAMMSLTPVPAVADVAAFTSHKRERVPPRAGTMELTAVMDTS